MAEFGGDTQIEMLNRQRDDATGKPPTAIEANDRPSEAPSAYRLVRHALFTGAHTFRVSTSWTIFRARLPGSQLTPALNTLSANHAAVAFSLLSAHENVDVFVAWRSIGQEDDNNRIEQIRMRIMGATGNLYTGETVHVHKALDYKTAIERVAQRVHIHSHGRLMAVPHDPVQLSTAVRSISKYILCCALAAAALLAVPGAIYGYIEILIVIFAGIWGISSTPRRKWFLPTVALLLPFGSAALAPVARIPFETFYENFGVTPEAAGWDQTRMFFASASTFIWPLLVVAICAAAAPGN